MSSWSENTHLQIDEKLKGVKEKDLRFYRIDEFKRNITRVENFANSCPTCKKEMINITENVKFINESVNTPGKKRRDYDRLISRLSKHMQREHGFFPPYYYTYLYSFWGIVLGLAFGFLSYKIIPGSNYVWLSLGFLIGIIVGYVWGFSKDKKIRKAKRLM